VVWIGLKNKETLIEMNEALENNLRHLGFKEERRKFDPHLTIARTRSSRGKDELKNFVIKNSNKELGTCFIQSVKLKKSTLTPTGPIYQTIKEVKLS
jgi:2'-5' RNA ligase